MCEAERLYIAKSRRTRCTFRGFKSQLISRAHHGSQWQKVTQLAGRHSNNGAFIHSRHAVNELGDMGTRHEQAYSRYYSECTSTYLLTILLRDKAPQTFIQKPKKEKTRAREPLIFLRAGMTGRLREAGPVTSPPLGGDSLGFGLATLGVSVSLARCQHGSGFEWRLGGSRALRSA